MGSPPAASLFCLRGSAAVPCILFFGRLYGVRFFFGPIIWHALMTPKSCCAAPLLGAIARQRNSRRAASSARGVAARWRSHYRDESPGGRVAAVRRHLASESPWCGVAGRSSCRRAEL